jgi:diguanylate cyclase (GGDEF)-like protein
MIQRRILQIFIISAVILVMIFGVNSSVMKRVDHIIYDTLLSFSGTSAPSEVVIVAIDETSIDKLGRWPWPRSTHGELLTKLTEAEAEVVGFDILFSEPEESKSDQFFSDAIAKHGQVILAVAPEKSSKSPELIELLPIPLFARHSAGFGHVDTELDIDGICRRVYLHAGLGDAHWPAFGLAVQQRFSERPASLPFDLSIAPSQGNGWVRQIPFLIPFYGPPGHITQYSYFDVLNGTVGRTELRNKIVIVGATAAGMGDAVSTPVSGHHQRMSGVELNANVVASLLDNRFIIELESLSASLLTIALTLLILPIAKLLPRRYFPLCLPVSVLLSILLCFTLFKEIRYWFAPTDAILAQLLFFSLISWRRYNDTQSKITQLNKDVYQQLNFDPLTHLPNGTMLKEQLNLVIKESHKTHKFALLVIQLSGVKEVNNRLGISAGDEILTMAAKQIQTAAENRYPVARLSGIEFAVTIPAQTDFSETAHIGRRLIQLLQLPCELEGKHFFFKPSIGVSTYPEDGSEPESLLSNAYTAMHKAKSNNKRGLYYYSLQLKQEVLDESSLTQDLHFALSENQLEVYYQPQVLSSTGEIIGLEALLRWKHPERGAISPTEFIPLAEKTGLILAIGDWVMETACKQVNQWNHERNQEIRIAVNLSAVQFSDDFLIQRVTDTLKTTGLPPYLLELELTESALMQNYEATTKTLLELKSMGIKIAVDDFGTGYSSLSYLKQFPLDRIKIDQSFVRDLNESVESAEITQAIITMAHNLNLKVIAEGVETPQQRGFLLTQTCEELQGFYFSQPLPKEKVNELLKKPLYITPHNKISPPDKDG